MKTTGVKLLTARHDTEENGKKMRGEQIRKKKEHQISNKKYKLKRKND